MQSGEFKLSWRTSGESGDKASQTLAWGVSGIATGLGTQRRGAARTAVRPTSDSRRMTSRDGGPP
jgi:hypothetical protein